MVTLPSCDDLSSSSTAGQQPGSDAVADATASSKPTIVSLTPAITQMLIDMGKAEQIAGVSTSDKQLADLPRCGTFNDPVMAKVLEINPALVLTESPTPGFDGVPPMLRSIAEQGVYDLKVIPHCRSVADVERALIDSEVGLGAAVGDMASAERARRLMLARLDLVNAAVAGTGKPRVLMLINPMTLGAIGTGVTHDELLKLVGGSNAAAQYRTGYITLTRSQIQQDVRPDIVLIFEPGGTALGDDDPRIRALEGLSVPAVTGQRIVVINHPQAMLPATSLAGVAADMAAAIHPERADAIRKAYAMADQVAGQSKSDEDAGGGK